MDTLPVNYERCCSIPNNNSLAYRNSTVIAHRLSIYMPNIFLPSKNPQKLILDINAHVDLFRDMLIHVGQAKDNPELRERIRKYRHICVEECKNVVHIITALVKSAPADCSMADTSHVVLLFYLLQLFSKELIKSYRLIQIIPMDMSKHYENRTKPTNLGNVIGQILLCKQIAPDFKQEELCSIANDIQDIDALIAAMQMYMPKSESPYMVEIRCRACYAMIVHSVGAVLFSVVFHGPHICNCELENKLKLYHSFKYAVKNLDGEKKLT